METRGHSLKEEVVVIIDGGGGQQCDGVIHDVFVLRGASDQ